MIDGLQEIHIRVERSVINAYIILLGCVKLFRTFLHQIATQIEFKTDLCGPSKVTRLI